MSRFFSRLSNRYANPTRFLALAHRLHNPLWAMSCGLLVLGFYLCFTAPPDYQQGDAVRIMFIHVPSAWASLFGFAFIAFASALALILRHPLGSLAARAAAPIGACFTLATLISGALWGKPIWGVWWVWDARLTSVLVLFFIYLGYMAIWRVVEEPNYAARIAAIFALVGSVNVPIVKFSVDWWNTLHQPASISRLDAPAIHPDLLLPLLVMAGAVSVLFCALTLTRMETEILRQRLRARYMEGDFHV